MTEPTKSPDDIHNQPADQKLINQHPELLDRSIADQVRGPGAPAVPTSPAATPGVVATPAPQPAPQAAAPLPPTPAPPEKQVGTAASERPPVATSQPAATTPGAGNDSRGIPRPHGPGGGSEEKTSYGEARREEQARRVPKDRGVED